MKRVESDFKLLKPVVDVTVPTERSYDSEISEIMAEDAPLKL